MSTPLIRKELCICLGNPVKNRSRLEPNMMSEITKAKITTRSVIFSQKESTGASIKRYSKLVGAREDLWLQCMLMPENASPPSRVRGKHLMIVFRT